MSPRGKTKLSREESLRSRPVKNEMLQWEKDLKGEVIIYIPQRQNWWVKFLRRFIYVPKQRRILLDKLGSEVWDMCDGQNTVKDIIERFRQQHKLSWKEAELSMTTYLKQMAQKGLIGFIIDQKGVKKDEERPPTDGIGGGEDSTTDKASLTQGGGDKH